jgi:hypothetical protein
MRSAPAWMNRSAPPQTLVGAEAAKLAFVHPEGGAAAATTDARALPLVYTETEAAAPTNHAPELPLIYTETEAAAPTTGAPELPRVGPKAGAIQPSVAASSASSPAGLMVVRPLAQPRLDPIAAHAPLVTHERKPAPAAGPAAIVPQPLPLAGAASATPGAAPAVPPTRLLPATLLPAASSAPPVATPQQAVAPESQTTPELARLSPPKVDEDAIARRVERRFRRALAIEAERRGGMR